MKTKLTFFLLVLICLQTSIYAQRSYVHSAMEDKYGEPGKDKANTWLDKVADIKVLPVYSFQQSITYHTARYIKADKLSKGTDEMYYYNGKEQLCATKLLSTKAHSFIITDKLNKTILTFDTEKMTLFGINSNAFLSKKRIAENESGANDWTLATLKPTGKSKVILGYPCKEYEKRNSAGDIVLLIWLAKSSDFSGINMILSGLKFGADFANSLVLEYTHYFKNQPKENMVATQVNKNEKWNVKSADYQLQTIGGIE